VTKLQEAINVIKIHAVGEVESTSIKFHKIGHSSQYIREFGHTSSYSTEPFEAQHKSSVTRHKGNLNHSKDVNLVLLLRELVANNHRNNRYENWVPGRDWRPVTKEDGHLRGRSKFCGDDEIKHLLMKELDVDHIHIQLYQKIWHQPGDYYITKGRDVCYSRPTKSKNFGRVHSIGKVDFGLGEKCFVVVSNYKESADSSLLSKFCTRMKLQTRKSVIFIEREENPVHCCVHMVPDFTSSGFFFLSNWFLE